MSEEEEALIDVDLGRNGGRVLLYSLEEITNWLDKEKEYWNWLTSANLNDSNLNGLTNTIHNGIRGMQAHANAIREGVTNNKIGNVRAFIINTYTGDDKLPHSSTAVAKFLLTVSKDDVVSAAHALGYFKNIQTLAIPKRAMVGFIAAFFFDNKLTKDIASDKVSSARESLDELYTEMSNKLAQQRIEFAELSSSMSSLTEEAGILIGEQGEKFDKLFNDTSEQNRRVVRESKEELTRIEKTYDDKLALSAPSRYWSKKRLAHRNMAWVFGLVSVVLFTAVGWAVSGEVHTLLGDVTDPTKVPYWRIGILVIFTTLALWVIRIVVRLFLSHIHLESDAAERLTMLHTYLALLRKKEGGLQQDDITLILSALFRSSSDGIVKDDSAPPGIYEFLTRYSQK
jgi:hypothetical protein